MKIATYKGRVDGEDSSGLVVGDAELPLGAERLVTDDQASAIEALKDEFSVDLSNASKGAKAPRADGADHDDEAPADAAARGTDA